jgi:secreted Zn-dependent insulinase-like peptidase
MNGINYKTIQTKEQLKYMLYSFHNTVNIKKGYSIFSISELDNKYSQMNLLQVIYKFMPYFQDKSKSIRMIANDFHRSRLAEQLKKWFNNNIRYFD